MHLTFPIRSDKLSMNVHVKEHVVHKTTEFQTIDIYDTDVFGKVLLLDGHVQLAEFDEHAYHECLIQIPLNSLTGPRRALVVGGGDGGAIRELVKSSTLQHIDMVEIDQGVVEVCRQHLPGLSDGAFGDPRVHVHIADAFPFVKKVSQPYDLIVMDSTDTYEGEDGALSEQLFTETFYRDCQAVLSDQGLLVTQADNFVFCPYSLEAILSTFSRMFQTVGSYLGLVPSFGGFSAFAWASNGAELGRTFSGSPFRYLNPSTFEMAFQRLTF